MEEVDTKTDNLFPLSEEQKEAVIKDLHEQGTTFFTWEKLQEWIHRFGPKAKMKDIQQAIEDQEDQEPKL
ncbi:hypothetical protein IH980_04840 [Patescibacteria group bacterium]|nr:hypothetical protein [Patescibacteria group bacterium]